MEINSKLNMRIVKKIQSHGANSSLYIVEDTQLNEIFMLKQIDKNKIKESSKYFDEVRNVKDIENKNIVLTRDVLMEKVCGYDYVGETNVIDVYIRYLRTKIDDRFNIKIITTVRGVGYVIKDE